MTEPFTPDENAEDIGEDGKPVNPPVDPAAPVDPATGKKKRNQKQPFERKFVKYEETEEAKEERKFLTKVVEDGGFDPGIKYRNPTNAERHLVRCMVFAGLTQPRIAACLNISEGLLTSFFRHELDNGSDMTVTDIAMGLVNRARAGSDTAAIFLLKVRGKGAFNEPRQAANVEELADGAGTLEVEDKQKLIDKILQAMKPAAIEVKEETKP